MIIILSLIPIIERAIIFSVFLSSAEVGSSNMTTSDFFSMERALEAGDGLGEAWEAFCGELTDAEA